MIIDFSVRNFRSIKETQTLSFQAAKNKHLEKYYVMEVGKYRLLKVAMLYGANASGKTNILRALDMLYSLVREPVENKNETIGYETFRFDPAFQKGDTEMEIDFIHHNVRYDYEVKFNHQCIVSEKLFNHSPGKSLVFERTTDTDKQLAKISFGSKVKVDKNDLSNLSFTTLWNNTVLAGFSKSNVDIPQLQAVLEWFHTTLMPIVTPRTDLTNFVSEQVEKHDISKDKLVELLNKADFGIDDIVYEHNEESVPEDLKNMLLNDEAVPEHIKSKLKKTGTLSRGEIFFIHSVDGNNYRLPLQEESRGTQRYYGLGGLMLLLTEHNSVLSVDELESSLHPDLYQHFLFTYLKNSRQSQLIVTTHNRELLNDRDLFRKDAIWITDRNNEEQMTELYSLDSFDSSVVRDTTNVYNAYRIGKLGGVPMVNDVDLLSTYNEKE